jgi:transposase
MISHATFCQIQHEFQNKHQKPAQIARRLNLHKTTVAKWIKLPNYIGRKIVPRRSKLDEFKPLVMRLRKQEGTNAMQIYRLLIGQGYAGSYSILKRFINNERPCFPVNLAGLHARQWMHKIMQCEISTSELQVQLAGKLDSETLARFIHHVRLGALRARNKAVAILAISKGVSMRSVSRFLFVNHGTISKWWWTFQNAGIRGLMEFRRGKPKKSDQVRYKDAIFSILHAPPSAYGLYRSSWRMDDIVQVMRDRDMRISKHCVHRIIQEAGYRFRKAKKVLTSNDPDYRQKLQEITGILHNLKPDEKFFSVDEYGPFAVKLQGGRSLVAPGEFKTVPQRQKSKGSLIMTAALELSENQVTHFYSERKNTDEMLKLLKILIFKYTGQARIYFSWDAASWHASKKLYEKVEEINSSQYRAKHNTPLVKLAPLPSCAQFLNVIESVFSGMARAIIHNSDYQNINDCKTVIDRYFAERNQHFNAHPKRAGNKIWGKELVPPVFNEANNCKDPLYRSGSH